jgi:hypothetical protein
MIFTGINYRSLPSAKTFSADFDFTSISYSGNMYDAGLSSGVHFGFSGVSDSISFLMRSGKIYDPQNKVVYSYSNNDSFSLRLTFNNTNYAYSFDEEEFCTNGIKNDFAINNFFFNSNGLTCDVTANIYGPEINYSIVFPATYSSSSLIGVFTNLNNFAIKIFSAQITNGNSNYYSTSSINNISIAANSSEVITLTDLFNETGISQTFTLTLYTNFGIIHTVVNSFRI